VGDCGFRNVLACEAVLRCIASGSDKGPGWLAEMGDEVYDRVGGASA